MPHPPLHQSGYYAADVASSLLGTGRAARLYRALVREQRVARDVVSYAFPLVTGASLLLVWATGYPEAVPEALEEAALEQMEGLPTGRRRGGPGGGGDRDPLGPQPGTGGERADLLGMFTTWFDDPERLNSEMERVRAVTPGEVRGFAAARLGPDNRAVVTYVPGGAMSADARDARTSGPGRAPQLRLSGRDRGRWATAWGSGWPGCPGSRR